jgi:CheY-like chemotaxis protein
MIEKMKIAILDDNFSVRQSIRLIVDRVATVRGVKTEIFSVEDGIEGLGYILVTFPDIIIIDTTLPKYSGREVMEYLNTNDKFASKRVSVIVLHDGGADLEKKAHFDYLNKQDSNFVNKFEAMLNKAIIARGDLPAEKAAHVPKESSVWINLKRWFLQLTIKIATRSDLFMREAGRQGLFAQIIPYFAWFLCQVLLAVSVTVIYLQKRSSELNTLQSSTDASYFRVRAYPTISMFLASLLLVVLQFGLLVLGGVVIFNSRVESVFADYSKEVVVKFEPSVYDNKSLAVSASGVELAQVKGAPAYPSSSSGSIESVGKIKFSELTSLLEDSTLNDARSSLEGPQANSNNSPAENRITYQLSADGERWFFWDGQWKEASADWGDANTVQEVNAHLYVFGKRIALQKELYLKVYFHSNNTMPVRLNKLTVVRELHMVTPAVHTIM